MGKWRGSEKSKIKIHQRIYGAAISLQPLQSKVTTQNNESSQESIALKRDCQGNLAVFRS